VSTLGELDVLYAGDAGEPRAEEFVQFLGKHVRSVRAVDRASMTARDLQGADVLIIDGDPNRADAELPLSLHDVRVPTVLIGGAGGKVADQFGLKLGWGFG
jgi:predicted glycosyltransferase